VVTGNLQAEGERINMESDAASTRSVISHLLIFCLLILLLNYSISKLRLKMEGICVAVNVKAVFLYAS